MSSTITRPTLNAPLVAARGIAALMGCVQLAGVTFFFLIAPEEGVWLGPWLDAPVVALILSSVSLKLGLAFLPGLAVSRRIEMGLLAVALGVTFTLLKISFYEEPEGVLVLAVDATLLAFLLLARRAARR